MESTSDKIFVTGGTGLVGSHLLVELCKEGKSVRALKRTNSNLQIVERIFQFYKVPELFHQLEWVDGDLTDVHSLIDGIKGCSHVYHTAALVSFDPNDRDLLIQQNIDGTTNLVNACLENGVKKLCYVSSTAAVGKTEKKELVVESNDWDDELVTSNYAISKHYAENEVWRGIAEGLPAVIVNPCVIIGPGDLNRSTGTLFRTIKKGLKFYTSGANAFVDVRDVVDAMTQLMNSDITEERYLLIGENLSFKALFEKVALAMKVPAPSTKVSGWLVNVYWRIEKVKSFITRQKPVVTKESSESATSTVRYSSEKIKKELRFSFREIDDAVQNAATFFSEN